MVILHSIPEPVSITPPPYHCLPAHNVLEGQHRKWQCNQCGWFRKRGHLCVTSHTHLKVIDPRQTTRTKMPEADLYTSCEQITEKARILSRQRQHPESDCYSMTVWLLFKELVLFYVWGREKKSTTFMCDELGAVCGRAALTHVRTTTGGLLYIPHVLDHEINEETWWGR